MPCRTGQQTQGHSQCSGEDQSFPVKSSGIPMRKTTRQKSSWAPSESGGFEQGQPHLRVGMRPNKHQSDSTPITTVTTQDHQSQKGAARYNTGHHAWTCSPIETSKPTRRTTTTHNNQSGGRQHSRSTAEAQQRRKGKSQKPQQAQTQQANAQHNKANWH